MMATVRNDVKALVKTLKDRVRDIENKFISLHSDPTEPASEYALDVQSYAILCHAAFEEFAESLCLRVLDEIENRWVNTKKFSVATFCLLHFDLETTTHSIDRWSDTTLHYDYIKEEIRERKGKLSRYAIQNNHGVGIKYLHSLFLPIGLDMPHDVNEKNSLDQLVRMRGFYAHAHTSSRPNAVTVTSPQSAVLSVKDVLQYMNKMAEKAVKMRYYSW